jgi:PilZ domain
LRGTQRAPQTSHMQSAVAVADANDTGAPLNLSGTRRAPRFKMVEGTEAQVDGKSATLVDMSLVGTQLVVMYRLTPNQRVRFTFKDQGKTIRIGGTVVWASFEVVAGSGRYRVGIEFSDADETNLQQFMDAKRKKAGSSTKRDGSSTPAAGR